MYWEHAGSTWELQEPNDLDLPNPDWYSWDYRRPTRLIGMIELVDDSYDFFEASCYSAFALRNDGNVYWWRHWVHGLGGILKIILFTTGFFLWIGCLFCYPEPSDQAAQKSTK
jgi:hypothetical protein